MLLGVGLFHDRRWARAWRLLQVGSLREAQFGAETSGKNYCQAQITMALNCDHPPD
jgi:hypothetical protein